MASAWQLECLEARINSLRNEISRVTEKQPLRAVSRSVYRSFRAVLDEQAKAIGEARRAFVSGTGSDNDRLDAIYDVVSEQLWKVTELFQTCDRVDSPRIPFELLPSLSAVARALLGSTAHILVHLSTEYNYQIQSLRRYFDERNWHREWRPPRGGLHDELLLMVFPSYEVGTTLLHAVAAHELAHELAHRKQDEINRRTMNAIGRVSREFNDEKVEWVKSVAASAPGTSSSVGQDRAYEAFKRRNERIEKGWVRETFADLVAASLVGPAFIGALDRISAGASPARQDTTHPPLSKRREIIGTYLKDNYPAVANDPAWDDVMSGTTPQLPLDVFTRCGMRICDEIVEPLTELITSTVRSPLADTAEVEAAVGMVTYCIDNLVPPSYNVRIRNDDDVASACWLLLYATWRYRVSKPLFDSLCRRYGWTDDPTAADTAINSLLLHSLQNLGVKASWRRTT